MEKVACLTIIVSCCNFDTLLHGRAGEKAVDLALCTAAIRVSQWSGNFIRLFPRMLSFRSVIGG
jgi:hypothetical protein